MCSVDEVISLLPTINKLPFLRRCIPEGVLFESETKRLVSLLHEVICVKLDAVIRVGQDRELS